MSYQAEVNQIFSRLAPSSLLLMRTIRQWYAICFASLMQGMQVVFVSISPNIIVSYCSNVHEAIAK